MHATGASSPELAEQIMATARELIEQGRREGFLEGFRESVLERLVERFGALSTDERARVDAADLDQLYCWIDGLVDAATVGELLASTPDPSRPRDARAPAAAGLSGGATGDDDDGPITLEEVIRTAGRAVARQRALTAIWHSRSPDRWVSIGLEGTSLRAIDLYTTGKRSNLMLDTAPHGELEFALDRGYWELDSSVGTRVDSRSEDDATAWVCITPVEPAVLLGAFVRGFRRDEPIPDWIRRSPHRRRSEFPAMVQVRLVIGPAPTV